MRRTTLDSFALVFACLGWVSISGAQQGAATTQPSLAQSQAQARPQIEQQRRQAEQQAQQSMDRDAAAALEETQRAINAIADGKTDDALAALERASGKINVLLGRNPSTALIPVQAEVVVIDTAPGDVRAIRDIAKAAERAVKDRDYPQARVHLTGLMSEIRIRSYNLPLASYPASLREAARLLQQGKRIEAEAALATALNTLVIIDRVRPLPIAEAQTAIAEAQALRDKDRDRAVTLLNAARDELERGKELGYAGNDPEYASLNKEILDIEKQLKGNQETASLFSRLKDRIGSFFKRQSESPKKSQPA
jgi:hypothetical protein